MRNMASIDKFETYNEGEQMLINHRIRREFMIKMYVIYLIQMSFTCAICTLSFFKSI